MAGPGFALRLPSGTVVEKTSLLPGTESRKSGWIWMLGKTTNNVSNGNQDVTEEVTLVSDEGSSGISGRAQGSAWREDH